ncbi:MAG: DUF4317 domain-containing protein [Lachnospiraceae bacterium]|nr:DUF4317 domain-containing protein [Lachnospiraceae bacterium]
MDRKDILELRRRFKKEQCNIDRLACCFIDENKNRITGFNESFLSLPTDEFEKFLDIAKKTMSGTISNNIMEYEFPLAEENGGRQQFFNGLKASGLKNEELLDTLYDQIIKEYEHDGKYLILVYHDVYDIMTRTSDNLKLDESEEVYEYILISICPMELSKPGIGYRKDENKIGSRIRDWVVGAPETGILFPAFDEHSGNLHRVDYFIRNPKESHPEVVEKLLGCDVRKTREEKKQKFAQVIRDSIIKNDESNEADKEEDAGAAAEKADEYLNDIKDTIAVKVEESEEDIEVTGAVVEDILKGSSLPDDKVDEIVKVYEEEIKNDPVTLSELKDDKPRKRKLKKNDVLVSLISENKDAIHTEVRQDQEFLMIPIEADSEIIINGIKWAKG